MKKIYLTLLSCFIAVLSMAQTPGFSYQAVILNPDVQSLPGNDVEQGLLSDSDIAIRFTIENDGSTEYQETHTTKTDAYGMLSLIVGQGMATIGNFTDVAWVGSEKYLKVEIDFTASGASYESLDRQALTYLPQPVSNETMAIINQIKADIINNNNNDDLQNEVIRATAAEQANTDALDAEIVRATAAEAVNTADIATNTTTGVTNATAIGVNTSDIATNTATGVTNSTDISTNASDIATNATDIAANASGISINASDISTNATDIAANASTGATNTSDIATNTSGIATNTTGISTNASGIATNTSDIATNTATGQTNANNIAIHNSTDSDLDSTNELQTLTISGDTLRISEGNYIILPQTILLGCTDSTAINYNSLANSDDGSCIAVILGCTNPASFNYDTLANTDDGTCIPFLYGCTDSTAYSGYNPLANTDDGSCVVVVNGCTDSTAFNYDSSANTDDGSCIAVVNGCTDNTAFNYNSSANTDDGSCIAVVNGCTDSTATNYNAAANTDDGSCTYIAIGDTYQGGIVFYIFQQGDAGYVAGQVNGLIVAPSDQSSGAEWGCYGTAISGADGTAIGTGNQNTIDIEAVCTTSGTAADICANLTLGGYSDWFLPSKDELNEMYLNLHQQGLGGFASNNYWSSTEEGGNGAWKQSFSYGNQYNAGKTNNYRVRAVRAF